MRIRSSIFVSTLLLICIPWTAVQAVETATIGQPTLEGAAPAGAYVEPSALCFDAATTGSIASLGYCDVAIEQLREGSPVAPAQAQRLAAALNNRALAALRQGEFEAASADFEQAFGIAGASPELLLNRGNLRLAQRRYREALADYSEALRLAGGELPAANYNSAFAHRALGAVQDAVADVLRAEGHSVEIVESPAPLTPTEPSPR